MAARLTLLRLKREVLIWQLSAMRDPLLPDFRLSSLPARSMMFSLPLQVGRAGVSIGRELAEDTRLAFT